MYSKKEIKKQLKEIFASDMNRYHHTISVSKTAKKLAKKYNCSVEKAEIASLLHDVTKLYTYKENKKIVLTCYDQSVFEEYNKTTIHALSGMIVARDVFGVNDEDILHAILCHTIGKPNMTLLEKILFTADYIEPRRPYQHCKQTYKVAFQNLNKAVAMQIDFSVNFYEKKGNVPSVAYDALECYKKYLKE